jgi:carbon-monoxide dehydrogenase medium subunit
MTTHHQVYSSTAVQRGARALSEAAGLIGDPLVRNRGTIGGSLCHADPGADLPAVMVALNAQIVAARQGGSRTIPAAEFFTDMYSTALQPGEVLTEVRVPVAAAGTGSAYVKFPSPASRYAVVGVAARVTVANGSVGSASVALTGAATRVARLSAVEQGVTGAVPSAETFQRAAARAAEGWEPLGDMHASGEYRQALAAVYAQKALTAAAARV